MVTQVTTNIMCRDGCTVVIGGLIRESVDDHARNSLAGQPALGGPRFPPSRHLDRSQRSHLCSRRTLCATTRPAKEGDTLACDFDQRRELLLNSTSPVSKRYMARRQLGLAKAAWIAGKQHSAEHHMKLALFYDPANLDIVRFRNEMLSAGAFNGVPPTCTTPWQNMSSEGVGCPSVVTDCDMLPPAPPRRSALSFRIPRRRKARRGEFQCRAVQPPRRSNASNG